MLGIDLTIKLSKMQQKMLLKLSTCKIEIRVLKLPLKHVATTYIKMDTHLVN